MEQNSNSTPPNSNPTNLQTNEFELFCEQFANVYSEQNFPPNSNPNPFQNFFEEVINDQMMNVMFMLNEISIQEDTKLMLKRKFQRLGLMLKI